MIFQKQIIQGLKALYVKKLINLPLVYTPESNA
jgi:hypothetical protein